MKFEIGNNAPKTKLITPFVTLAGTAVISIVTFLRHFPFGEWIVVVFGSVVLFLILGYILEKVIVHFMDVNFAKEEEERRLAEEEAARAAEEAAENASMENNGDIPGGNGMQM